MRGFKGARSKEEFKTRLVRLLGDFNGIPSLLNDAERDVILSLANQAMAHEFDLLGSGPVKMEEIDWHSDFKSGNRWKRGVYYKKQRSQTKPGADIKVPWELSRCHHLLWLGEAWLISHDDKFAREVVSEIEDWIVQNPLLYSVNWVCTMDVAIRAVNWLYALLMVIDADVVTDAFIASVDKSLFRHGWFIFNNLEKNVPYSNNHLFSDYAGLLYLGLLFSETKRGKSWKDLALREFFKEIRRQILPSGVQYERSVSYHRLMTELVSYPCYMLKRIGFGIPVDIEYRVRSMYSFVATYTKANGRAPLIEDNDDGRFLPFLRRDYRRHDYLLVPDSVENKIIAIGLPLFKYEIVRSRLYKDAGHSILRNGDAYLFATNGGFSKYETPVMEQGTHTHNDRLSFELAIDKDDIIVDPGSYVYTPNPILSNEFHSTIKHNTVVVDDEEQNELNKKNVFLLKKNSKTISFEMDSNEVCSGEYKTLKHSMAHRREFYLKENALVVNDTLLKKGGLHHAVFSFHLSPEVKAIKEKQEIKIESSSFAISLLFDSKGTQYQLALAEDTYSPSYGVLQPSQTVRLELSFYDSISLRTILQWQRKQ